MRTKLKIPKIRFKEFSGEWEEKKLGEVSQVITGNTPPTNNPDYYNGEYLFISPFDIKGQRFIIETNTTLTKLGFEKGRKIKKGSIVFVCIGSTIGKVAQVGEDCITNQQINSLTGINGYDNNYIYSLLNLKGKEIKLLAGVQAVPQINKTDFSNLKFLFPQLPEQQKIASFLSSVDEKIEKIKEKKKNLLDYKKGVMQKIFSQEIRFKNENGEEFGEWEEKKLGEICEKQSSNISANTLETNTGNYKIYGATGFLKYIDFYQEENDYISIVKDGAGVGRVLYCEGKSSVLGTLDKIKPKKGTNLYFLLSILRNIDFTKYTIGSTIPHIYFKDYGKEKFPFPTLQEQEKIADFLSGIDEKIEKVSDELGKMEEFKKGLLQGMFV